MELLEVLKIQMDCDYISDLPRLRRPNTRLRRAVGGLSLAAFPAREWLDAADYLCGMKCQSATDARNTLLSF